MHVINGTQNRRRLSRKKIVGDKTTAYPVNREITEATKKNPSFPAKQKVNKRTTKATQR